MENIIRQHLDSELNCGAETTHAARVIDAIVQFFVVPRGQAEDLYDRITEFLCRGMSDYIIHESKDVSVVSTHLWVSIASIFGSMGMDYKSFIDEYAEDVSVRIWITAIRDSVSLALADVGTRKLP